MTRYLWLCHSSGGNLPPSLGVARELRDRGHDVSFLLKPEMTHRIEAEGLRALPLSAAYAQIAAYPDAGPITRMACSLTAPDVAREVADVVAAEAPDALLIDAMFPAALAFGAAHPLPTIVFCHTFLWRQMAEWQGIFDTLAGLRAGAGFDPLPDMQSLWKAQDRMIVTSVAAFDDAPLPGWDHVRHVGPSLTNEAKATPIDLPWAEDDPTPLVLLSFTTTELAGAEKLQTALDALAGLPVHVVATTSAGIDPAALIAPANAHVVAYADHDQILRRAAMTVTHGGHGTLMRVLRHGVPMVVIPGLPHDQAPNGQLVQRMGAGIALPGDAGAVAIRKAAETILGAPSYRLAAQDCAARMAGQDGAKGAADAVEAVTAGAACA
jgi:UDP:flavonoid glycosyltransferase YjiC (YdhE family)